MSVPLELVSYPRFLLFAALWKSTVMRFIIYPIVFLYILTGVLSLPLISKGDHDMYVTHIWLLVLKSDLQLAASTRYPKRHTSGWGRVMQYWPMSSCGEPEKSLSLSMPMRSLTL